MTSALPPSLWADTAPPGPEAPALAGSVMADIAIIGGGYTGLSTALHVAERDPAARVVVLEAAQIGWGASGRNNGQVIPAMTRPDPSDMIRTYGPERGVRFAALIRDSAALTFDLIRSHGIDCEAVQQGWLQPAHLDSRLALSEKRVREWGDLGAPVRFYDRDEMAGLLGTDRYHGGWGNSSGGHLNPLAYARGLARAAQALGVAVHEGSPVTGIEKTESGWRLATPQGSVTARQIVLATAGYTDDLWPGLKQTVVTFRNHQASTEPIGANQRTGIVPGNQAVSDTRGDLYFFRFEAGGRLVTGANLVSGAQAGTRLGHSLPARLAGLYPALDGIRMSHVWDGRFAVTVNRFPRLLELAPGAYGFIGCNGRGVALTTVMGPVLAALLLGDDRRNLPLPVEAPRPLAFHAIARRLAQPALLWYRWKDRR